MKGYRGRIAPSPTGYLHLGHARTFWTAQRRAINRGGVLVLRNEDLDHGRCRPEFAEAMFQDLKWFGFRWHEGPDVGGFYGPYTQSERLPLYRASFEKLKAAKAVYPCTCSRQDVLRALQAPHQGEDEPVYPGTCRPDKSAARTGGRGGPKISWRFRVPDGRKIDFHDGHYGLQTFIAGVDFGDFVVWRHDDLPSYQLAVVADDAAMGITEVVRGEDLLKSTARQLLLYEALGLEPPTFCHCPLVRDETGTRLAKRHDSLSLRNLKLRGLAPEQIRADWTPVAR